MRRFVDLHLKQPENGKYDFENILKLAAELGYSAVGISRSKSIRGRFRMSRYESKLKLISRIDIRPRSVNELSTLLRRERKRFEVVAVNCHSKKVARQAAKDHRVDLLYFPSYISTWSDVWFDRHEAALASGANCAYEINASDLLKHSPTTASKFISLVRRGVENANKHEVPIVISSGADSCKLLRSPLALIALMELVGVKEEEGLDMVSQIPWRIIEFNREKLESGFVVPGVRIAKEDAEK